MEREETKEKESGRKTEKERHEMKYKVGDKVRVRSDLKNSVLYGGLYAVDEMLKKKIVTITSVHDDYYKVVEDDYKWTDKMFEGLVEDELTAEEAIKTWADMCDIKSCADCKVGKLVKEAKYSFCSDYRREHPDKVVEVLKQLKKEHEKKEVEVESKLYCRIIDGGDGSTVRSEALQDGINLNDEIKEILAKYCSEHVGDYFAVCEKRWMVKQ